MPTPPAYSIAKACRRAHGGVKYSRQLQLTSVVLNLLPMLGSETLRFRFRLRPSWALTERPQACALVKAHPSPKLVLGPVSGGTVISEVGSAMGSGSRGP